MDKEDIPLLMSLKQFKKLARTMIVVHSLCALFMANLISGLVFDSRVSNESVQAINMISDFLGIAVAFVLILTLFQTAMFLAERKINKLSEELKKQTMDEKEP